MFKKLLSLPNHSIRVCVKEKRINQIPAKYILHVFYGNEKAIQWAKRTLDAVSGKVKKF